MSKSLVRRKRSVLDGLLIFHQILSSPNIICCGPALILPFPDFAISAALAEFLSSVMTVSIIWSRLGAYKSSSFCPEVVTFSVTVTDFNELPSPVSQWPITPLNNEVLFQILRAAVLSPLSMAAAPYRPATISNNKVVHRGLCR